MTPFIDTIDISLLDLLQPRETDFRGSLPSSTFFTAENDQIAGRVCY